MTNNLISLAERLTSLERELLLGESKGWGSWMFEAGVDLCAKGLGRRDGRGSIYLDTPLADELRAHIRAQATTQQEER